MNLQELLLHMDKGLAGVIVPTMLLIGLMMIPYVDRGNDGQGGWFATPNAIRITVFSFVYSSVWIIWLILWDASKHVEVYRRLPVLWGQGGKEHQLKWLGDKNPFDGWPGGGVFKAVWDFIFLKDRLSMADAQQWHWRLPVPFQPGSGVHDGYLDWPRDFEQVPLPLNGTWLWFWDRPGWMPGWMLHVYWYDSDLSIPKIMAEYVVPSIAMIGLPALMILILVKLGWATTVRDAMIALFTGFILVYFALTIVGAAFRGHAQALVPFWHVPNLDEDPHIQRMAPRQPHAAYGLVDPGTSNDGHA